MSEQPLNEKAPDLGTSATSWRQAGGGIEVPLDRIGRGHRVLFLPALSTIASREEMRPLLRALGPGIQALVPDWPGFGRQARPALRIDAAMLADFLAALVERELPAPACVVAAGHGAGFALRLAASLPGRIGGLALIAPTWRGPLPTVMNGYKPAQGRIRAVVEAPLIGPPLYALNVSRPVIKMMMLGHVLADPAYLTPQVLQDKLGVAHQTNARFASAAFVTGGLDPFRSRADWLAAGKAAGPIRLVLGPQTPRRSRAEMDALAGLENVDCRVLPQGALAVHEEFPDSVAAAIRDVVLDGS